MRVSRRIALSLAIILLILPFFDASTTADSPQPEILLVRDAHYSYKDDVEDPNQYYGKYYDKALNPKRFLLFPYSSLKGMASTLRNRGEFLNILEKIKKVPKSISAFISGPFKQIKGKVPDWRGGIKERGRRKDIKRVKQEVKKSKEFEKEAEPELEGVESPEERVSKLTEIRRRIEKEKEKDKKD